MVPFTPGKDLIEEICRLLPGNIIPLRQIIPNKNNIMIRNWSIKVVLIIISQLLLLNINAQSLREGFVNPPKSARPWVYWFWINGNITREGITADLEAMQKAGIGGVLIMEMDDGAPVGPVNFAGPKWIEMFKYACTEADRLGLEVNINNGQGWGGSGGSWITPELSMQKIVWSETTVEGPKHLEATLPTPSAEKNYYRDIVVLAFPTPSGNAHIGNLAYKACFSLARPTPMFPIPTEWPEVSSAEIIARDRIVDMTIEMDNTGKLIWDVPDGKWTILRIGHTTTGAGPAPIGSGLECDKMSKEAVETHFTGLIGKLIEKVGPLTGKALVATHIDSWECGTQNWTPKFRDEFKRRRGYDLVQYLPTVTGRIVQSREISERFLWDFRQTINELVLENYAGHFSELAHQHGMRFTLEAYTTCPCDELSYSGRSDEPMGEAWSSPRYLGQWIIPVMTSGGHIWGKKIIGAEAFSSDYNERWQKHPANLKELGDWAFCEGVNRLVVHRYAMQPWTNIRPGMSMGPWGVHYERTQTWWEMSTAWHAYLSRCQYLLRQGLFTADICYLSGEGMPQSFSRETRLMTRSLLHPEEPRDRTGYNFDICPQDALMTRMSVKDGRLVLPDGMNYRLLVLPTLETMTPQLLGKIKELVEAGATVVGSRPSKSPSLSNYPQCDREVEQLTEELWGHGRAPAQLTERKIGKGRLFWSDAFQKKMETADTPAEKLNSAQWIWYPDSDSHWDLPAAKRYFRRAIEVDATKLLKSAQLLMTADDCGKCWVNGQLVGGIESPLGNYRFLTVEIGSKLKPGKNLIAMEANNGVVGPNPAGIIAAIRVDYSDSTSQTIYTDSHWESAKTVRENWISNTTAGDGWTAAREFGPLGTAPWQELEQVSADTKMLPEEELVNEVMAKLSIPPDFDYRTRSGERSLRYTHRTLDSADIYFVANKLPQAEQAICSFRVQGKHPELWWPELGCTVRQVVYEENNGITRVPICFSPSGSVFVVFLDDAKDEPAHLVSVSRDGEALIDFSKTQLNKQKMDSVEFSYAENSQIKALVRQEGKYSLETANGKTHKFNVTHIPKSIVINGPWELDFHTKSGTSERVILSKLISWSEYSNPIVKYFSGTVTYTTTINLPGYLLTKNRRLFLDLGEVQVMAEVKLNGKNLGILWKAPFRTDITSVAKLGNNKLEINVVNLLINRMIGDEQFPEDSKRNPDGSLREWPDWVGEGNPSPTGRYTFTSWKLWPKDAPLQRSGLLGPVTIQSAEEVMVKSSR
jgi:hypothetical protein